MSDTFIIKNNTERTIQVEYMGDDMNPLPGGEDIRIEAGEEQQIALSILSCGKFRFQKHHLEGETVGDELICYSHRPVEVDAVIDAGTHTKVPGVELKDSDFAVEKFG
ncbi:MAG: hypothetical protein VX699_08950 [Myxococcota bacterium]|nr:hypothetical protein [Myxococcota bacterium]